MNRLGGLGLLQLSLSITLFLRLYCRCKIKKMKWPKVDMSPFGLIILFNNEKHLIGSARIKSPI